MKAKSQKIRQPINKLILFVSEACNLRCAYCYIRTPGINSNRVMSEDIARSIARSVFSKFEVCNFVQFFGGEPTLNLPAMVAFIDEIKRLKNERIISKVPSFGIVTNGASPDSGDMVSFCKEYGIGVTISLDGPKHIHDSLRPNALGGGTFDNVLKTIGSLLEVQMPVFIETVYTSVHIDRGYSIVDLFKFVWSLGVKKVIFHTAYPPAPLELCPFDNLHFESLRDYHIDAVNWWFESLVNEKNSLIDVYFKDLLVPLLQGGGAGVTGGGCPAGIRDFTIGPTGDVYSCHLLYDVKQFHMGNILSDDCLQQKEILPLSTKDLSECSNCFARFWCQPCGALNLNWGDLWTPPKLECELRREVLLRIGELAFENLVIPDNSITKVLRNVVRT